MIGKHSVEVEFLEVGDFLTGLQVHVTVPRWLQWGGGGKCSILRTFQKRKNCSMSGQWDFYSAHYVEQDRVEGMEGCFLQQWSLWQADSQDRHFLKV